MTPATNLRQRLTGLGLARVAPPVVDSALTGHCPDLAQRFRATEQLSQIGLTMKRLLRGGTLLCLALLAGTFSAWAQNYPVKPIRMFVAAGAGGTSDVIARAIAQKLSENLGQQVVVDNRPGANGVIGADAAAKAVPDGYSIILGSVSTHGSNPSFYTRLPYDPVRDFAPISMVGQAPYVIVVQPSFPANSVKEFIAQVQAKPGQINYGAGTNAARVGTEMFTSMTGIRLTHVPYKSTAQALTDLMAGQVQVIFEPLVTALPHIKAGKLKVLGITSAMRLPMVPDIPTVVEAGVAGYEYSGWLAMYAPAGVPRDVVQKLNTEIAKILPGIAERLRSLGFEPQATSPEQLSAYTKSEIAKYAKFVKEAGIQPE
jgi:tripartite-type tricarboxylate transporter receptor subunit TctC